MSAHRAILLDAQHRSRWGATLSRAVGALVAAGLVASWLGRVDSDGTPVAPPVSAQTDASGGSQLGHPAGAAASLHGTHPDGRLHLGDAELVLSADLIRRFDYWLTTHGEKPLPAIRLDVQADLADELNESSLQRALRLFDAYVGFKTELARLQPVAAGQPDTQALALQMQAIRAVRARHFSVEEVAALFAAEDASDDHALARLRIAQDPRLSEPERRQRLAQISQKLPAEQRAAETEPVLHLSVADAVAEARARGADASEVKAIRTRLVGADAAERLATVDAEQAAWQARVQTYLAMRQAQPDAAAAHKTSQFSPTEQLRLGAYE